MHFYAKFIHFCTKLKWHSIRLKASSCTAILVCFIQSNRKVMNEKRKIELMFWEIWKWSQKCIEGKPLDTTNGLIGRICGEEFWTVSERLMEWSEGWWLTGRMMWMWMHITWQNEAQTLFQSCCAAVHIQTSNHCSVFFEEEHGGEQTGVKRWRVWWWADTGDNRWRVWWWADIGDNRWRAWWWADRC